MAHDTREKLIFAPTGTTTDSGPAHAPGQAAQFLQHESSGGLRRTALHPSDPIAQFHAWFAAASSASIAHPETCTLSTAELPSGRVSARQVYLKELLPGAEEGGFVVYTNLRTSRKAADLATNPHAALTFWWAALERQVRVEGKVERVGQEEAQKYFSTRARGSRIGAWASKQSRVLEPLGGLFAEDDGRATLDGWVREMEERFEGTEDIPVPDFWGGLRIVPDRIEFWQGRESRLHDRFVYEKVQEGEGEARWTLERVSP